MASDWPWAQVVATILGSGVVAAGLNAAVSGWQRRGERKREAAYTALRVALALERFAEQAADALGDLAMETQDRIDPDDVDESHAVFPPPPDYPSDLDWRTLNAAHASSALGLVTEVRLARSKIGSAFEIADFDEANRVFQEEAITRGLRAWELARRLRSAHRLPQLIMSELPWDYRDSLQQAEIEFRRAEATRSAAGYIELE